MIFENEVYYIALTGMSIVALGFIYVISEAGKPVDKVKSNTPYVIRRWLFVVLLLIITGTTYGTLIKKFPIPEQHSPLEASEVVKADGHQWFWVMSTHQVETGKVIQFDVTSSDVNHGFAIYAPDGRIATQTQAMPGFTNKLLYKFTEPGTYTIRCLEYCGLGHHIMETKLNVVANSTGGHA